MYCFFYLFVSTYGIFVSKHFMHSLMLKFFLLRAHRWVQCENSFCAKWRKVPGYVSEARHECVRVAACMSQSLQYQSACQCPHRHYISVFILSFTIASGNVHSPTTLVLQYECVGPGMTHAPAHAHAHAHARTQARTRTRMFT